MSERTAKVASIVKQIVAAQLTQLPEAARLTVTSVDVSPDLRHALVRIGILAQTDAGAERLLKAINPIRPAIQEAVSSKLATKFVPQLRYERDMGGEYADHITKLIKGL